MPVLCVLTGSVGGAPAAAMTVRTGLPGGGAADLDRDHRDQASRARSAAGPDRLRRTGLRRDRDRSGAGAGAAADDFCPADRPDMADSTR